MSKGDNSPGMSKFAGVLNGLVNKRTAGSLVLDFGVIQKDKSLLTNTYPVPIPVSDYLVARSLKSRSVSTGTTDGHHHSVSTRQALQKGDRVIVAWVQNDAVVLDVIVKASDVL